MFAWRLTLIVQDGRIYGRVVFIICECKWGPLLKCRGSLHVVETLRECSGGVWSGGGWSTVRPQRASIESALDLHAGRDHIFLSLLQNACT